MIPRARAAFAGVLLALCAAHAGAIDNPDAPDDVAQFETRAKPFEARIDAATSTKDIVQAYGSFGQFLDGELNKAYQALLARVDAPDRPALVAAQRRWIAWRDAENKFVGANWTQERFGTSAAVSIGAYRTDLIKTRTIELLRYLKEYPAAN